MARHARPATGRHGPGSGAAATGPVDAETPAAGSRRHTGRWVGGLLALGLVSAVWFASCSHDTTGPPAPVALPAPVTTTASAPPPGPPIVPTETSTTRSRTTSRTTESDDGDTGDGDDEDVDDPTTTTRSAGTVVRAGAFCSSPGAVGVTSAGHGVHCRRGSDGRERWGS